MNITDSGFQVKAPLSLPEDEVQLWRIDLEAVGADESHWRKTLSSDELERASRFHFPRDRQRFASSRSMLRVLLAGYLATDPAAAKSLIDQIAAEVGPPEVLVNTIGTFRLGEAVAATQDDLRVMMDVNLGAALWLSQAVEPHMRQRGKGSIVHVSARPGTDPTAGMAAYSLSKAALSYLIRILDVELRPHGIRVNAVAPQLIDTATNRATFPAELLAHAVRPEAIANVIAFLAGDLAAPVSGAIVPAYGA